MTVLTITAKGQVTLKAGSSQTSWCQLCQTTKKIGNSAILRHRSHDDPAVRQRRGPKFTIDELNEIATQGWAKAK